jgi:hypothetical protein
MPAPSLDPVGPFEPRGGTPVLTRAFPQRDAAVGFGCWPLISLVPPQAVARERVRLERRERDLRDKGGSDLAAEPATVAACADPSIARHCMLEMRGDGRPRGRL